VPELTHDPELDLLEASDICGLSCYRLYHEIRSLNLAGHQMSEPSEAMQAAYPDNTPAYWHTRIRRSDLDAFMRTERYLYLWRERSRNAGFVPGRGMV